MGELGRLGLEPGFNLLYYFGRIHGLPDSPRTGAAAGLAGLAAPGATLLLLAFKAGRRFLLPRRMEKDDIVGVSGDDWRLEHSQTVVTMPSPLRRANPTFSASLGVQSL